MSEPLEDPPDLRERLFTFALRVIRLCGKLQEKPGVGRTLSHQLVRAGTSIGANYEEAQGANSRADFANKCSICLKEARETCYWLRLIAGSQLVAPELLEDMIGEAGQIMKIFGSIVARCRRPPE